VEVEVRVYREGQRYAQSAGADAEAVEADGARDALARVGTRIARQEDATAGFAAAGAAAVEDDLDRTREADDALRRDDLFGALDLMADVVQRVTDICATPSISALALGPESRSADSG
jgi:hypothetical protein